MFAPVDRTPDPPGSKQRYAPPVAEFLSAAWLEELDTIARKSDDLAALGRTSPLVIEQCVTQTPNGEVSYHVIIDASGAHFVAGRADAPHITLTSDFATASAIHRGDTNAQRALNAGMLKIGGEVAGLLGRGDALGALQDVFAGVRDRTTGTARPSGDHR